MPFRELLREYPGIPRIAPRMAFSLRERFFQIGVVPRFLNVEYDWTTGAPNNGNEWRKCPVVPRSHPLCLSPCFLLWLIGLETEGFLDYQGKAGDHCHCMVEPSPGRIRCRKFLVRASLSPGTDHTNATSTADSFLA